MYAKENYIEKAEPGDSLAQILAHRPTMHNFSVATGLEPVAKKLEGDTYFVCELQVHGIQGCADLRNDIAREHFAAEVIALGLALFVAVIVGSIAVGFVSLVTKLAKPVGEHRVYALFPRRVSQFWKGRTT